MSETDKKPSSKVSPSISVETAEEVFQEIVKIRNTSLKQAVTSRMKKLAGIKEETELEEGPRDWAKKAGDSFKRNIKDPLTNKEIDIEDIREIWKNAGQPTRIDELIHLLQKIGFSDREIKMAMDRAGVEEGGELETIRGLADALHGTNLVPHVLNYLGVPTQQDPNDSPINNREIRMAFEKIADLIPAETTEESVTYENETYGRRRKQ